MAIDIVKPLKIENPASGGSQTDPFPTEAKPTEDYAAFKGIAFEGLDTHLIEKIGGLILDKHPDSSEKPTYLVNGELDYIEFFNTSTQITSNRLAKVQMSYDVNLNPTTETWYIYSSDGTTVLRTIVKTYTFVNDELTNSTETTS